MPQNGQAHFKNLAANAAKIFKNLSDHFETLCMKGLSISDGFLRILVLMLDLNMKNGSFLDQSKACTITYDNFEKKIHKEVV